MNIRNEMMTLYHTGSLPIPEPDIRHGRKYADFGQGFYLSPDKEFSRRWARERRGEDTYINSYELSLYGLKIREMERDEEWFGYIYDNRQRKDDAWKEYDVLIGPIANDTIYDVLGITTSGIFNREESLKLLMIGPKYRQVVIKSDKAVSQLRFLGAEKLDREEIRRARETVRGEEREYQKLFADTMRTFSNYELVHEILDD